MEDKYREEIINQKEKKLQVVGCWVDSLHKYIKSQPLADFVSQLPRVSI